MSMPRLDPGQAEPERQPRAPSRVTAPPRSENTAVVDLQGTAGNRAVAAIMTAPAAGALAARAPVVGDPARHIPTIDELAAAYPHLLALVPVAQLQLWEQVLAGWRGNHGVDDDLARQENRARLAMYGPGGSGTSYRYLSDYRDRRAQIADRKTIVDESSTRVSLRAADVLGPDVVVEQPWNVSAEHRFRAWLVAEFAAHPLVVELTSRREIVSALEESQNPGLAAGKPHLNLLWGGGRIKSTGGQVRFADLMDIARFREAYYDQVTHGPEVVALKVGLSDLESHLQLMEIEHQERSDINAGKQTRLPQVVHGAVRRVAEWIGKPSAMELVIARMNVQANPNDREAVLTLAELEGRTEDYPRLHTDGALIGIWDKPWEQWKAAQQLADDGKTEIAVAALSLAEQSATISTARYAGYERRITSGASTAVTWLNRAKTAGKIASAFTGTGGVLRAAAGAAGYGFAQEGLQQVAAHAIDPSNKIDLAGLAEQAAIEGLAALLGGMTQGAFTSALKIRFGATLTVRYGLSEVAATRVLSAVGAGASSFYGVPAKIVLEKIIAGNAVPSSLAEVCDLVVTEAATSTVMDAAGSFVHAHQPELASPTAGPPAAADPSAAGLADPTVARDPAHVDPHQEPVHAAEAGAAPTEMVKALARPDPQGLGTLGSRLRPVIDPHARQIAQDLMPVFAQSATMTPQQRLLAIRDAICDRLVGIGLPRPDIVLDTSSYMDQTTWMAHIDHKLLSDPVLSAEKFAQASETIRHEVEHAVQFFRIGRRQGALHNATPAQLSQALALRIDVAQAAVDANLPGAKVEVIPAGGALEQQTDGLFDSYYGVNSQQRNQTYTDMAAAGAALSAAMGEVLVLGPGGHLPASTSPRHCAQGVGAGLRGVQDAARGGRRLVGRRAGGPRSAGCSTGGSDRQDPADDDRASAGDARGHDGLQRGHRRRSGATGHRADGRPGPCPLREDADPAGRAGEAEEAVIGRRELRTTDLAELVEALCREEVPNDLDLWGTVEAVDQLGFIVIDPVTRWPGVASMRFRAWTADHPGDCHLVLSTPIRVPSLAEPFKPLREAPRPPGAPSARLHTVWEQPDLPTRATVLLELGPSGRRVAAITFVTESMARYR